MAIAVPAVTTSPGSAVRVATVPVKGAMTFRSLRFARASSSWARARSASACAAAMSACAWRIWPCTAATCDERMAGFTRFARAVVSAPRAASTWRREAATIAACASSLFCARCASCSAISSRLNRRAIASRSHFACA